jgi:hypothetical protein
VTNDELDLEADVQRNRRLELRAPHQQAAGIPRRSIYLTYLPNIFPLIYLFTRRAAQQRHELRAAHLQASGIRASSIYLIYLPFSLIYLPGVLRNSVTRYERRIRRAPAYDASVFAAADAKPARQLETAGAPSVVRQVSVVA